MKKYSVVHWSLEQKWMAILLPMLLLYNGRTSFTLGSVSRAMKYNDPSSSANRSLVPHGFPCRLLVSRSA